MKEKTSIETITPEIAESYLETNYENNRKLSQRIVNGYAEDMKRGNWLLNPAAHIVFCKDGTLYDGQHRLYACVQAGVPFVTYVTRGCDPRLYHVIDTGRSRTAADVLGRQFGQSRNVVALAKVVIATRDGNLPLATAFPRGDMSGSHKNAVAPTKTMIVEDSILHEEEYAECIKIGNRMRKAIKAKGCTVYAYFIWLVRWLERDSLLDEFVDQFCDPSSQSQPINYARFKIMQSINEGNNRERLSSWTLSSLLTAYTKFSKNEELNSMNKINSHFAQWNKYVQQRRKEKGEENE